MVFILDLILIAMGFEGIWHLTGITQHTESTMNNRVLIQYKCLDLNVFLCTAGCYKIQQRV